jgi:glutamine amidotransferase
MGWNSLKFKDENLKFNVNNPLFKGLDDEPYVYFVHSYYVPVCKEAIAIADYILPYSASMHKDNFYTCQFHPEKSGKVGERILENFLKLTMDNR